MKNANPQQAEVAMLPLTKVDDNSKYHEPPRYWFIQVEVRYRAKRGYYLSATPIGIQKREHSTSTAFGLATGRSRHLQDAARFNLKRLTDIVTYVKENPEGKEIVRLLVEEVVAANKLELKVEVPA